MKTATKSVKYNKTQRANTVYLQGIAGYVYGTPAGDLKPGDTMVWNGGGTSEVDSIVKETKAFVTVKEKYTCELSGDVKFYERRMKKTRIVARPYDELPENLK